jgi:precorrin-2 dehydrogenase/sirohydrochlorin ferrochelatase
MPENTHCTESDFTLISLISKKIKVLIIGGGRAGFIKAKSFTHSFCNVFVVSNEFCDDFNTLKSLDNISFIQDFYKIDFILDKHIVIIATGNKETDLQISADCEKYSKLYISCADYKNGNMVRPLQRETDSMIFGLHSKSGNPNASLFTADLIEKNIKEQDDFINYINTIRSKVKGKPYKDELMKFVTTEDFIFFYNNNVGDIILQLFYPNNSKSDK